MNTINNVKELLEKEQETCDLHADRITKALNEIEKNINNAVCTIKA